MKLKRCPNMHYYDEDKYAQCPHCAAARPVEPAPVPKPAPQPVKEPVKEPAGEPAPDGTWRCSCGAVNNGKFCVQCGSRKPSEEAAAPEKPAAVSLGKWVCSCGNENEGNFCNRCGSPRPAPAPRARCATTSWTSPQRKVARKPSTLLSPSLKKRSVKAPS